MVWARTAVPPEAPEYPTALQRLAVLQAKSGAVIEAQASMFRLLEMRPNDPEVHAVLGWLFYLAEDYDRQVMIECARLSREIFAQPAFTPYAGEEVFPGANRQSDEELLDFIRRKAETVYHPVGTCRMGSDDEAVVDPSLNVRGIESLSVVDASVMPDLVSGNTNAPTIMIAEKASDMLLEDANCVAR